MSSQIDWSAFPHVTGEYRELADRLAQGLGPQALAELLASPPEHHIARLDIFRTFVQQQRARGGEQTAAQLSDAQMAQQRHRDAEYAAAIQQSATRAEEAETAARAAQEQARMALQERERLNSALTAAQRARNRQSVKIDTPKFDGSDGNRLTHWLLAVERASAARLIEDEDQKVSFGVANLRGKASEWAYSALLANPNAFPTWSVFKTEIRAVYQAPNHEVLLQARFFATRQGKRSLHQYVQEMRSLAAQITTTPLPESVKVPAFLNGLRHGPARQQLYRSVPATMESAISIAFIEEQSSNAGRWDPAKGPSPSHHGAGNDSATPMDLSTAEIVCYGCGKRGHKKNECRSRSKKPSAGQKKSFGTAKKFAKTPAAQRRGGPPAQQGKAKPQ